MDLHGITTETAISKGTEARLVFREFVVRTLPPDGFVVSYNMEHEHTVFMNSFNIDQIAVWDSVPKCVLTLFCSGNICLMMLPFIKKRINRESTARP